MNIKKRIFHVIEINEGEHASVAGRVFDVFIISLILLSVAAVIIESFKGLSPGTIVFLEDFEFVAVIVFTIEYFMRIWTADLKYPEAGPIRSRIKFIFSGMGLIDLFAILPFYLPFLMLQKNALVIRLLRIMRLLRVLKLNRYNKSISMIGKIILEKKYELGVTMFVTFILLLLSSAIMYNLEHNVQPDAFPNIMATLWWAVSTLTTVGYGDVVPATPGGKIISAIIAVMGVGLVALPAGILSLGFFEKLEKEHDPNMVIKKQSFKYCPHCGKPIHE
jgi:voltage-gated potassium channel